jgi:hypothetical protein
MGNPKTLPADFFEKQASSSPPKTLPADFDFSTPVTPESQRPDATKQAQAVIKNAPMTPSYSAMALANSPSGADPHNPGNPNLNALPPEMRESVSTSLAKKQAGILAGQGLGALAGKAFAPTITSETVPTGLLGPSREELTKVVTKYGPSAVQKALANPMAKQILKWVGEGVGYAAAWKAIEALGVLGKKK